MKQKLIFLLSFYISVVILNAVFFFIAEITWLGNSYSFVVYLFPFLNLIWLWLLLSFQTTKFAAIIYSISCLILVAYLYISNTIESHDFLEASLMTSRFPYVVIHSLKGIINADELWSNALLYLTVFALYYFMIFKIVRVMATKLENNKLINRVAQSSIFVEQSESDK